MAVSTPLDSPLKQGLFELLASFKKIPSGMLLMLKPMIDGELGRMDPLKLHTDIQELTLRFTDLLTADAIAGIGTIYEQPAAEPAGDMEAYLLKNYTAEQIAAFLEAKHASNYLATGATALGEGSPIREDALRQEYAG